MQLPEFLMKDEQRERCAQEKENITRESYINEFPSFEESSLITNDPSIFMDDGLVDTIRRIIWESVQSVLTYGKYTIKRIDASFFDSLEKRQYVDLLMGEKCIIVVTNASKMDIYRNPVISHTLLYSINILGYFIVLQDKKDRLKEWFIGNSGNVGKHFVDDIRKNHDVLYLPIRENPRKNARKKEDPKICTTKKDENDFIQSVNDKKEDIKIPKYSFEYRDSVLKRMELAGIIPPETEEEDYPYMNDQLISEEKEDHEEKPETLYTDVPKGDDITKEDDIIHEEVSCCYFTDDELEALLAEKY